MTDASVDTQNVPVEPRGFYDGNEPEREIPEIAEVGGREAIRACPEDALRARFDGYVEAAPILVEHHDYQRERFDDAYEHYINIFTKLETLKTINDSAAAIAPDFQLLEEFELLSLDGAAADWAEGISKVMLYGGAGASVLGVGAAVYEARYAGKVLQAAKGGSFGPANSAEKIGKAKWARRFKWAGVVGATLSVTSAAVGIYTTIENEKQRLQFLQDAVESYQTWYASTRTSIDSLKESADEMEAQIQDLMDLLGYSTPESLETFLGGAVQTAGEVQASLRAATRMLCAGLEPEDVVSYTGLPAATISRRAQLIANDRPTYCPT